MIGPQLKINGEWIALPEDFSLSLEQSNPLFNDQGTFSFPFEVPMEPNRHVFKNLADPFGHISLKAVNGLDAELWFGGIMLYKGKTETEQEVEISDSVPITFVSGNSDFKNRIDGMNARDVPLDREIKLGYVVEKATYAEGALLGSVTVDLPDYMMMNFTEYNVTDAYPSKKFCNVRVCTQGVNEEGENDGYAELEAKRPFSGVCFYVMYFIDCLLNHFQIHTKENQLTDVEDMKRLAFFTTSCDVERKGNIYSVPLSEIKSEDFCGSNFDLIVYRKWTPSHEFWTSLELHARNFSYKARDVYATSKNFPDVSVSDIISDMENAFGVRFVYDSQSNDMRMVFLRNVFRDNSVMPLSAELLSYELTRNREKTIVYGYGEDSDTAFNYYDYSNVKEYENYRDILRDGISPNSKECRIDKKTGNAYRVKVNKDTGGEPVLFEVGGFNDFTIGDKNGSDKEEVKINFRPVIVNDLNGKRNVSLIMNNENEAQVEQKLAVFASVEIKNNKNFDQKLQEWTEENPLFLNGTGYNQIKGYVPENFDITSSDEPPLRNYDAGYTMGVMRGPGNQAGIDYNLNYDNEGNDHYFLVASNYSFTADSCDSFGNFFDYNGTLPGGVENEGRFSLKITAKKEGYPIGAAYDRRGLADTFLSEYLYFLTHRKLVTLSVKMSISEIIHIDFLKRHRIGEFVGFINKVSYSLDESGVNDVEIEMYIL